ncbi:MAG TPA: flagellar hook-basal body complex protein FliE [Nocardioides sp.]|nr:flagellar hook-basal body complex protein FliE [Nocardioides sp.]
MSISPIEFPSFPMAPTMPVAPATTSGIDASATSVAPAGGVTGTSGAGGNEFGSMVLDGLDRLEGLNDRADNLAVQAATGKLDNIHDYTIAASEAQVATQLTVALRNKAVDAFNEIMRMQV